MRNNGVEGRGITAEDVTVRALIPAGVTVVNATGAGYQGVKMEGGNTYAEWTLPRSAPKEAQTYTITLSRAGDRAGQFPGRSPLADARPEESDRRTTS